MSITKGEIETLFVKLAFGIGGYLVARQIYEYIDLTYDSTFPFWIGIFILLFMAYKYKLRLPYMLNSR